MRTFRGTSPYLGEPRTIVKVSLNRVLMGRAAGPMAISVPEPFLLADTLESTASFAHLKLANG